MSLAQTASQITPPSFAPPQERQSGFAIPGAVGLGTPAGAEKLFVKLSGVAITGGLIARECVRRAATIILVARGGG